MTIRSRLMATVVGVAALNVGAVHSQPAPAQAASANSATQGAWQAHKLTFNYMGFTTIYTCDGLRDKLSLLLKLTGAAPDYKVNAVCARGFDHPDRLASADLTFASLQPGGPEPLAAGDWQHVDLSPHHPFDMERGDCELVEEFRDRILPMFAVRNVVNNVSCVPHQDSGSNYRLSFDVFAPVRQPKSPRPVS
jgi:hypothetical protein